MKSIKREKDYFEKDTWEEKSGLIQFLSEVAVNVDAFNRDFDFDIHNRVVPPHDIDGDADLPHKTGFLVTRDNQLMPELTYCLYSVLRHEQLYGHIGIYRESQVKTLRELKPIKDFRTGKLVLHDWLTQLVRASCEKITL